MTISFESRWGTRRVKTLTTKIGSGKTPSGGSESYLASGVPFLRSQNIHFNGLRLDDVVYIGEATHREMRGTRVKPDDVLLNITGASLGRVSRAPEGLGEANVNQHVCIIRPNTEANARYLAYALSSRPIQEQISELQVGGNREGLNFEQVGNLSVPAAPVEEQHRITDFLDAETARIDRLADRYQKLSDLAVERARAVIDKALIGFSAEFSVPASAVCSAIVDCVNKTAPTSAEATPYKMIRTSNIRNGDVDLSETFSVERRVFIEWNRRGAPRNGDILFTREAPLGQVGMLRTDTSVFLGQRIMLYRANENAIKKELLLYNFLGSHMDRQFRLLGAGSLHEHMRVGDCLKLRIYCPPRTQQDVLVAEIEAGREKSLHLAKLAKRQLALLAERRQALITAAVTGQFDVSTASGRNVTDGVSA